MSMYLYIVYNTMLRGIMLSQVVGKLLFAQIKLFCWMLYGIILFVYVTWIIQYEFNQNWYYFVLSKSILLKISIKLILFTSECSNIIHNYRYGWFISIQLMYLYLNHLLMFTTKRSILYIHIQHISKIPETENTQ